MFTTCTTSLSNSVGYTGPRNGNVSRAIFKQGEKERAVGEAHVYINTPWVFLHYFIVVTNLVSLDERRACVVYSGWQVQIPRRRAAQKWLTLRLSAVEATLVEALLGHRKECSFYKCLYWAHCWAGGADFKKLKQTLLIHQILHHVLHLLGWCSIDKENHRQQLLTKYIIIQISK